MAHMLEVNGAGKASMGYIGATPWHGLGTAIPESLAYEGEAFQKECGLDWEANKRQLYRKVGDNLVPAQAWEVVRSTDGAVLADMVGARFTIVQNRDAFKWFQPWLDSKQAALHTAGALFEGSRIWVLAKLNRDPMEIAAGDIVEKYILLSHSHDGSLALRVGFTPIRVVCWNTLSMAHGADASKLIRLKHTKNVHVNLDNLRDMMNLMDQEFEATAEQYRLLATKSINQADVRKYVKRVFELDGMDDISTRQTNIFLKVEELMEAGKGNNLPSVKGTYWAAYNGVTEYLSYESGRNADNRLNALWFGQGSNMNQRALQAAVEMATGLSA